MGGSKVRQREMLWLDSAFLTILENRDVDKAGKCLPLFHLALSQRILVKQAHLSNDSLCLNNSNVRRWPRPDIPFVTHAILWVTAGLSKITQVFKKHSVESAWPLAGLSCPMERQRSSWKQLPRESVITYWSINVLGFHCFYWRRILYWKCILGRGGGTEWEVRAWRILWGPRLTQEVFTQRPPSSRKDSDTGIMSPTLGIIPGMKRSSHFRNWRTHECWLLKPTSNHDYQEPNGQGVL